MSASFNPQQKMYKTREVAKRLGISRRTVGKLCRDGTLRATKDAQGHWQIPEEALEAYEAQLVSGHTPPGPKQRRTNLRQKWETFRDTRPLIFWLSTITSGFLLLAALFFSFISAGADFNPFQKQLIAWGVVAPFEERQEGEILIVLVPHHTAREERTSGIHEELDSAIKEATVNLGIAQPRVESYPFPIPSGDLALATKLRDRFDASIIVWGSDTDFRITTNFYSKATAGPSMQRKVEENARTALALPEEYVSFVTGELSPHVASLALYATGRALMFADEYQAAIICFEALLSPDSEYSIESTDRDSVWFDLGYTHVRLRAYEQAIIDYDQAIALDPQNAAAFNNRGSSYLALDEYRRAITDYDQAITLDPQDAATFSNRGVAHRLVGEYESAIADYDQAIALDPQNAAAFNNRGSSYLALDEYRRAITDYDQAITLDPQNAAAFNNRGNAYAALGKYDEAITGYDQAITLDPQNAAAFYSRGNFYLALDEYRRAITDYDQAITLDPKNAAAFNNRGNAYAALGRYDEAITDYDQAITLDPQYTAAFYNRGKAYAILGAHKEAVLDFRQYLKLDPDAVNRVSLEGIIRDLLQYVE